MLGVDVEEALQHAPPVHGGEVEPQVLDAVRRDRDPRAAVALMEADPTTLAHRNAFNVTAMNVTPAELADAIRVHIPKFTIAYDVDPVRQAIAESWPNSMDDSEARAQWGWAPQYDLAGMVADMLTKLDSERGGSP